MQAENYFQTVPEASLRNEKSSHFSAIQTDNTTGHH
jgi:hypothetical protein